MKKLLIILSTLLLFLVGGCSSKSKIQIHNKGAMYVSSSEYEKLTCKELDYELYNYGVYSCEELKDNLLFISPTEYKKLSCKQLHEQMIKIDKRLNAKLKIKSDKETDDTLESIAAVSFITFFTAGVGFLPPPTDAAKEEQRAYKEIERRKVVKFNSELKRLKEESEVIKDIATKKNCSFVADICERK